MTVIFVQSVFVWCCVFARHHGSLVDSTYEHLTYYIHLVAYKFLICSWYFLFSCFVFLESTISSNVITSLLSCSIRFSAQSTLFSKLRYGFQVWTSVFHFQGLCCEGGTGVLQSFFVVVLSLFPRAFASPNILFGYCK